MAITTYLFDIDEALIDPKTSERLYTPLLAMIKKKLILTDERLERRAQSLGLLQNERGQYNPAQLCKALGVLPLYYEELAKHIQPSALVQDNIETVFRRLKLEGKHIGIVSNTSKQTIQHHLDAYKLTKYTVFAFGADDGMCLQSNALYWRQLAHTQALEPAQCIVVGDDEQELALARNVGFATIPLKDTKNLKKITERLA